MWSEGSSQARLQERELKDRNNDEPDRTGKNGSRLLFEIGIVS